jgi:hypothetical protein
MKKIFNFLLLFSVTGLVLYFSLKDNFNEIINIILNLNKFWLIIGFLLVISYWFFKAIVLHKIVDNFNQKYTLKKAFRLIIEENFFHAITPFASGGQPYQMYSLKKDGLKMADATNVAIQGFVVYQIALVTLGIIAIISNHIFGIFHDNSVLKNLVTIGFITNFLVTIGLFLITFAKGINKFVTKYVISFLHKIKIVKDKNKQIEKFNKYINELHDGSLILLKNKKKFVMMILIDFVSLICLYLIPLVLLYATGDYTSINGLICIVTSAYVMLIGSFVPIPGGTGGLEYGFIKFFGEFISGSVLNAIMLIWRFITYYFAMILGAITLNIKKEKK